MSLDLRKLKILEAIINDYIMTAVPVGSRTVSKRSGLNLSSATIRNEMFDLKELGLLEQPHTSSGSMPSEKAYRLYVNRLMRKSSLTPEEAEYISQHFSTKIDDVEDVIKQTALVLSQLTSYMSMVISPQLYEAELRRIQIIPITDEKALLVVASDVGLVRDAVIRIPASISDYELNRISEMLTNSLAGMKLNEISDSCMPDVFKGLGERREYLEIIKRLADSLRNASRNPKQELETYGVMNLLSFPEYSDIEAARNLLEAIEHTDVIYSILANAKEFEFTIKIGSEIEDPKLSNCSIVTATYSIDGKPLGSMGVLGPTRMNYSRVLAILTHIGKSISEILTQMYLDAD
ncbi:MAG TPA: heat-inducible transcription repressor HrcA [Clostridiales bacterium]|jgi:heat-inducible transcriptional repressor|nr:heat-inducible transcription repressor HrcA [Clostridiales bacterium]